MLEPCQHQARIPAPISALNNWLPYQGSRGNAEPVSRRTHSYDN